jgi:hypothetical protein
VEVRFSVRSGLVAINDSYTTNQDQQLAVDASGGVLANDCDPDGEPLTAALLSGPSNGSLTLNADGSFVYTPNSGFYGFDSFIYQASDGNGETAQATATIEIDQADPPQLLPTITTMISSSPNASVYGQDVSFVASVTAADPSQGTPTGTVEFWANGIDMGAATLDSNGIATLHYAALDAAVYQVNAEYNGDNVFDVSTSDSITQTVNKADTTTALASDQADPGYGSVITVTATVTPVDPGGGIPTGTVDFYADGSYLGSGSLDSNGQATYQTSTLTVGTHSITASYDGDNNFNTSDAPALSQVVNPATSITVASSQPNPSVFGQSVTLSATVAAADSSNTGVPSGTVIFYADGNAIGSATLDGSGNASIVVSSLTTGGHVITGAYQGDQYFGTSTSSAFTQTVNQDGTSVSLSSDQANPGYGATITFSASVTAASPGSGTPTGTVQFFADGVSIGTGTLDSSGVATLQTSTLAAGSHTITAHYVGDSNFTASDASPLSQTVNQAVSVTVASSNPNPSIYGQSVTLTATVAAQNSQFGVPTGTVTFYCDGSALGTGTLDGNGVATLSVSSLAVGGHTITAVYNGDSTFGTSTSADLTQTVNQAATASSVSADQSEVEVGTPVTFTARVSVQSPGAATPSGNVHIYVDGNDYYSGTPDANGQVTWQTSSLDVGTHTITVHYDGDTNTTGSDSSFITVTIDG